MNMHVKLTYKKRFCRTQQDFLQAQIPIKGMLRVKYKFNSRVCKNKLKMH